MLHTICNVFEALAAMEEKLAEGTRIAQALKQAWPELAFEIYDVFREFGLEIRLL